MLIILELSALKIQMHKMLFDTSFNSLDTALANLYRLFHDAAQRMESYMRSMTKNGTPSFHIIKGTHVFPVKSHVAQCDMFVRTSTPDYSPASTVRASVSTRP